MDRLDALHARQVEQPADLMRDVGLAGTSVVGSVVGMEVVVNPRTTHAIP